MTVPLLGNTAQFILPAYAVVLALAIIVALYLARQLRRRRAELATLRADLADIKNEQDVLRLVTESANDGLLLQELDATIIWANPAYCETMGWSLDEIIGRKPQEFVFPEHLKPCVEEIAAFRYRPDSVDFAGLQRRLNVRKNGEEFWHEFHVAFVEPQDGDSKVVLVSRDITQTVQREQELEEIRRVLEHHARHDGLTGLPNRAFFLQRLAEHLARERPSLGVLQLDLNKFKAINDSRGHEAGDRILQHVAQAIKAVLRPHDFACRLGGDEFSVAVLGIHEFAALSDIADRLAAEIARPIDWRGERLAISASIGISASTSAETSPETLLRHADFALYEAKNQDRPRIACYDADLHMRQEAEQALVAEFDEAIDNGGLTFAFQPIVDGQTGRCAGFETLARWTAADGTPVSPPRFLEFAQRLRRKHEIDLAAMRAALAMAANAGERGTVLRAAFNASTETLIRPDFVAELEWETDRLNLDRATVVVEVLETTFFGQETSNNSAARTISALRKAGFNVMLDDFGVGYAGLSHLDKLDISGLKIDRSLTVSATELRSSSLIVQSLVALAKDLSLTALAEGVETEAQARHFAELGCDFMQGYAFGRPMPAEEFLSHVARDRGQDRGRSSVA